MIRERPCDVYGCVLNEGHEPMRRHRLFSGVEFDAYPSPKVLLCFFLDAFEQPCVLVRSHVGMCCTRSGGWSSDGTERRTGAVMG